MKRRWNAEGVSLRRTKSLEKPELETSECKEACHPVNGYRKQDLVKVVDRKRRPAVNEQNIATPVHTYGGNAENFVTLSPHVFLSDADHTVVLNHSIVFLHKAFPVLVNVAINNLYLRGRGINGIKDHECSKSSIDMSVVDVVKILHVSGASIGICIQVHAGIDRRKKAKFVGPLFCCSRIIIMFRG